MDDKEKEKLQEEAEHEAYLKWDCPYKSLSEVGSYCYASLCAVSLNKLYQGNEHDKYDQISFKCLYLSI